MIISVYLKRFKRYGRELPFLHLFSVKKKRVKTCFVAFTLLKSKYDM